MCTKLILKRVAHHIAKLIPIADVEMSHGGRVEGNTRILIFLIVI